MKGSRLHKLWDQLTSSYWFVPLVVTGMMIALGFALVALDRSPTSVDWISWMDASQPEGARALLSTIAGATITIASLTFSITIVALTLASGQFGNRLLYKFMRSRVSQCALGTFVGVFAYCLVVLQSVRSGPAEPFVPRLATSLAVAFAIAGVGLLVYFIHHVALSIQATTIIASVSEDLRDSIERFFPADRDGSRDDDDREASAAPDGQAVRAARGGILQVVEADGLVAIAKEHGACFHLERRPGDYVVEGTALARLCGDTRVDDDVLQRAAQQFVLGRRRTLIQDVEFALQQLVEIAVRALSPGINDPFTACSCIDELASALARIMTKGELPGGIRDQDGVLRVALDVTGFDGLTAAAFDQIRQHAARSVAVRIRLLDRLRVLAGLAARDEHLAAIEQQAVATFDGEGDGLVDKDLRDLRARRERFDRTLAQRRGELSA
ncbi:MAG: DUF2254 domain-containing protein [Planctomycetota bacterium]